MSLGDKEWSLQSKKEVTQTREMRHEPYSSSCIKIWNSKFGGNIYSNQW